MKIDLTETEIEYIQKVLHITQNMSLMEENDIFLTLIDKINEFKNKF